MTTPVPQREKMHRHTALFDDMAHRVGVDLQDDAISGALTMDEISHAVARCCGCEAPEQCAGLLRQEVPMGRPPNYCRNGDLLMRLKGDT
ncbi:DUF6455 family protein [Shimia sp. R11_0]|uniref:DUF6455 family protein n=1 Tax=Shimia sp. R11_0 TaxID=2821096 RepID=UPI001FFE074A|nr:DUF6455 family protein [Shimia sp. R11_0]